MLQHRNNPICIRFFSSESFENTLRSNTSDTPQLTLPRVYQSEERQLKQAAVRRNRLFLEFGSLNSYEFRVSISYRYM